MTVLLTACVIGWPHLDSRRQRKLYPAAGHNSQVSYCRRRTSGKRPIQTLMRVPLKCTRALAHCRQEESYVIEKTARYWVHTFLDRAVPRCYSIPRLTGNRISEATCEVNRAGRTRQASFPSKDGHRSFDGLLPRDCMTAGIAMRRRPTRIADRL